MLDRDCAGVWGIDCREVAQGLIVALPSRHDRGKSDRLGSKQATEFVRKPQVRVVRLASRSRFPSHRDLYRALPRGEASRAKRRLQTDDERRISHPDQFHVVPSRWEGSYLFWKARERGRVDYVGLCSPILLALPCSRCSNS